MNRPTKARFLPLAVLASAITLGQAANHREAPLTALDHKADITDVYAFVSYGGETTPQPPERVTLILCVDPLLEPANGPTLFPFDPEILYEIKVDNDHDAIEDVVFQFEFGTEYRLPGVYTAVAGVGPNGANAPGTSTLVVPPQITDFANPGLNQFQTYKVTLKRGKSKEVLTSVDDEALAVVPGNAGPRTMDYAALFQAGIHDVENDDGDEIKVFAGTTDDAFWIDLGATFDTANFRTLGSGVPGVLTPAEDAADENFASDTVSGYAVNTIAVEVPIELLTKTGKLEPSSSKAATIGVWGTTSRHAITVRPPGKPAKGQGPWRQVQRMGNPLINELLVGIGQKDKFSMAPPAADAQFAGFFLDPPIVRIVEALYGGALKVPAAPRTDLLPLVKYLPPIAAAGTPAGPIADLLRLNTGVPATPLADASRLGLLGGDPAGFPNGRRVFDDVTDLTLRVGVGGVLAAPFPGFNADVNGRLGDGVNVNDTPYLDEFPYVGLAPDGRNRRHVDPGEDGGGPVD